MDQEYCLSIYPYPKTGDEPSSYVQLKITGDFDSFYTEAKKRIGSFDSYRKDAVKDYQFQLHDGVGEDFPVYCNEEDIIFALLGCCNDNGVTVTEINDKGTVYSDISAVKFLDSDSCQGDFTEDGWYKTFSVRLSAKKKDCDNRALVYFFGPYVYEDIEHEYETEYLASSGIVEAGKNRWYMGMYDCEIHIPLNKDGSFQTKWTEAGFEIGADNEIGTDKERVHTFLDVNQEDVTFSVLIKGRLCPKIIKNDHKVIFCHTDFLAYPYYWPGVASYEPGRHPEDVVFIKKNGEYQYSTENRKDGSRFSGVTFIPPQMPDWDSLDGASAANKLYQDYLDALCAAFSGAKEYRTDEYGVFERGDEERVLRFRNDAFTLDLKFVLPDDWKKRIPKKYDVFEFETSYFVDHNRDTELWDLDCPSVNVNKASFTQDGVRVSLFPRGSGLELETFDSKAGEQRRGSFEDINKEGFFRGAELPKTIRFSPAFKDFVKNSEIYKAIKNEIVKFGAGKFASEHMEKSYHVMTRKDMEERLSGDGMVVEPSVIHFALKMWNKFSRTNEIPNIAVMGEAGIGKTTIVDRLAKAVCGKGILKLSPSDFKSQFVGDVKTVVVQRLLEAAGCEEERQPSKILFIDEAYELMKDELTREAISILLPLMTHDRMTVDAKRWDKGAAKDIIIKLNFETGEVTENERVIKHINPGFPAIWIAGYEDDIRLMLKENEGLYRRFERITLTPPDTDTLYKKLIQSLEAEVRNLEKGNYSALKLVKLKDEFKTENSSNERKEFIDANKTNLKILKAQCEEYEEPIKKILRWASQPQNSKYFGNYAGVETFLSSCLDEIEFSGSPREIKADIDEIITQTKRDIKHQLDTVRRKGGYSEDAGQVQMIVDNQTRFRDLVGCEAQVEYMQRIIDMFKQKGEAYERFGITIPKGALMLGRPGVGKTFIARAMAGEMQAQFEKEAPNKRVGFMSLSAPELTAKPVSFIGAIFDKAEEYDVCVIFIDEVDAIAKRRGQNNFYSHLIELIKQMDGVEQRSNVFILAATNAPEFLDPAFTRSGRIDKQLAFTLPNLDALTELAERNIIKRCEKMANVRVTEKDGRKAITDETMAEAVKKLSRKLAEKMDGRNCTAGDVENIINAAFVDYVMKGREKRGLKEAEYGISELEFIGGYLEEAVERHFVGFPRAVPENETFSVEENNSSRSAVAIHEVGHALVKVLCGARKPFERITSLPRGDALGYVTWSNEELHTKRDYENQICSSMGGKIAEELVYGKDNISPGAAQDMKDATRLARFMVELWGFTDEFEFMSLQKSTARYLGESEYDCSDAFRERCDQEVNALLKRLYQKTKEMLSDKKELIIELAREVFHAKSMTGEEFIEEAKKRLNPVSNDPA